MRQLSIGFEFRLESQINKLQLFLLTFSRNCLRSVLAKQMAVYKTGTPSQNQTKNKIVNMCTFYFSSNAYEYFRNTQNGSCRTKLLRSC